MSAIGVAGKYQGLRSFAFGDSPALADELLALVLDGVKTATCSTADEPNTSTPGERWVVLDGRGEPRCVIESTEVSYRRYDAVDAAFAHDEGEGDRSLAYWRSAHRRYFERLGKFSEGMMLMCERFRLVEIFAGPVEHDFASGQKADQNRDAGGSIELARLVETFDAAAPPPQPSPASGRGSAPDFGVRIFAHITPTSTARADARNPSPRRAAPPLPLAGEGRGGGVAASEVAIDEPRNPTWKVSSALRANARALRKNSTDAERILWSELRDHRLNGASFRRQVPIGQFVADFVCHASMLVIELDGGQHYSDGQEAADIRRSAIIEAKGFKVLRFSNHDVMTNRAGVLETIAAAVARASTPRPKSGREDKQADPPTGKPSR